jgi:hypothetical protein
LSSLDKTEANDEMLESDIPVPNLEFKLEELDDELLLYHPAKTKTVYMNSTASLVWQLCDGERSVGDIAGLLKDSFPEASDSVLQDVEITLKTFVEHGAIELK